MCGSVNEQCNPYELAKDVIVQKMLLLVNTEPKTTEEITEELGVSKDKIDKHLEKLVKCGLVAIHENKCKILFPLFTLDDQKVLKPLIDELAEDILTVVKEDIDVVDDIIIRSRNQ